ncbi:MAG: hypothetical protein ACRDUY_04205 [Nitriliruptorales bacterium]
MLKWVGAAVVLIAVAVVFGPKWVLAPLIGVAVYAVGTAMLRSLARDARSGSGSGQPARPATGRTLYRCEQCGAEYLLVVRGDEAPPRHCGERMHERVEVARTDL